MGVLYGKYDLLDRLTAYKVRPASQEPPGKFETGTGNFEGICGVLGALEYLEWVGRTFGAEQREHYTGEYSGRRDRFLMILLYDTGARIREILDLKLKDIHLNDQTPCIYLTGKGNKTRAVPLMDKTIAHLHEYMKIFHPDGYLKNDQYLFYTLIKGLKGKMSDDNVSCFLKRYAESAHQVCSEIPLRMHAHLFRHTRAMHLYQSGIPLSYIKDFLGHVSIDTTDIYASTDTSMMRAALEKINTGDDEQTSKVVPVWQDNEEMILKLCGLI
jgi:integrase/recombinase XerD